MVDYGGRYGLKILVIKLSNNGWDPQAVLIIHGHIQCFGFFADTWGINSTNKPRACSEHGATVHQKLPGNNQHPNRGADHAGNRTEEWDEL